MRTELGHFSQEGGGDDGADPGDLLQVLGALLQLRLGGLKFGDLAFAISDLHGGGTQQQAVTLLGLDIAEVGRLVLERGAEVNQLLALANGLQEGLFVGTACGGGGGLDGAAIGTQEAGINGGGLGVESDRFGVGPHAPRQDHAARDLRLMESGDDPRFRIRNTA